MKNRILLSCLFLLLHTPYLQSELIAMEQKFPDYKVNYLTYRIIYRFYLINRLTPTIQVFFSFLQDNSEIHFYKNSPEVTCLDSVQKNWNDFCAYRHLLEPNFEFLFIKCLYILIQNFILDIDVLGEIANKENNGYVLLELVSNIEKGVDILMQSDPTRLPFSIPNRVSIDTITQCFYIMKRLERSVHTLYRVEAEHLLFKPTESRQLMLHDLEVSCTHPRITQVLHDILQKKSIKPLLKLCEEFQQYRYADDSPFLREMLSVLLTTYRDLLTCNKTTEHEQAVIQDQIDQMLHMYQEVDLLSTEQVLDCIDYVTDYLDGIIKEIEQRNTWYNKLYYWVFG